MRKNKSLFSFLLILTLLSGLIPNVFAGPLPLPEAAAARHGMVASQHELASRVGIEVLKKGGNAIDAAIAVGLALAVVYPEAGNIGGGGFMVIRLADGTSTTIDYREMAPAAADRNVYLDANGNVKKGDGGPVVGYRAAGVPGTIAGFEMAYRKHGSGKLKWADLVEPARKLASEGFVLNRRLAQVFKAYQADLLRFEDSKRIFLNGGKFFEDGDVLKQADLAATLSRIAKRGADEFYKGETARLIAEDMKRHDGLITLEDLANYKAVERKPVEGTYRGNKIISMPPPSSGGIILLEILNMLEQYDIGSMEHNSSEKYQVLIEAMKRAFADRAELMGDSDFVSVPAAKMISKEYAKKRASTISSDKATPSSEISAGLPSGPESNDTTHFTVIDKDGNVVSNTYTLNNLYGSAVTAKGTGILLNDEMDDFAASPGKPNMFGLVQGEKNSIQPGKRPLSSMTPTIVCRPDGSFWFAIGARGGPRIISAVIQTVINMIDHKMDLQNATDAPRVHHQWLPDQILYEPYGLSPDTRNVLESYGQIFVKQPGYVASGTGVAVDSTGYRFGVIDSRGDGSAIGY